jgi:hypothetical protein
MVKHVLKFTWREAIVKQSLKYQCRPGDFLIGERVKTDALAGCGRDSVKVIYVAKYTHGQAAVRKIPSMALPGRSDSVEI